MMTVYAALDHHFHVRCDHPGLRDRLIDILEPLQTHPGDREPATYELLVDREPPGPFELWCDDALLLRSSHPAAPYARLLQQVNHRANRLTAPNMTVLHSAAAISGHGPVLLPASMNAGKSTLVTDLVRHGWAYLTDELVALHPTTSAIRGFTRAISLDRGSWPLFPDLEPRLDASTRQRLPAQWQIPPSLIGRVGEDGLPPGAIVTHHYEPSGPTGLERSDPVDCLRRLISVCFSFDQHVERDLASLARAIDRTPCYSLEVGDLSEARNLLLQEFGTPADAMRPAT